MYTLGIDIGSTASKAVLLLDKNTIVSSAVVNVGIGSSGPERVVQEVLKEGKLNKSDLFKIVVTGYGRVMYKQANKQISELSCHAKGANFLAPFAKTVIDIGGQDVKILKIDKNGRLLNFIMNDKCAAGTGRFLDVMANVLEIKVSDIGELSIKSKHDVNISNTCTVFAESEVISHLAAGIEKEDICAGICKSIAKKVSGLAKRIGIENELVMTGGVANNKAVVRELENELGVKITIPEIPQLAGALGAAIFACK